MKKALAAVFVVVALIVGTAGAYKVYRGMRVRAAQPCWGKLVNIQAAKGSGLRTHGKDMNRAFSAQMVFAALNPGRCPGLI